MSEAYYICRGAMGNWSYMSKSNGWCKRIDQAATFPDRPSAFNKLNGRGGSIWSESELKASPYYQAEMKKSSPKNHLKLKYCRQ